MTTEMSSTEDIIGRKEIDDLEAIPRSSAPRRRRPPCGPLELRLDLHLGLREGHSTEAQQAVRKAKNAQWNGETDLPWDTDVDQEKLVVEAAAAQGGHAAGFDIAGTPLEKWGEKEFIAFGVESQNWTLSQSSTESRAP